jgi:O-antigen/teichoic acid export membrane protein
LLKNNIKNISYQSVAQIIPRAIMFIFVLYLAKAIGKVEYGKFEFAMSVGYLVGMFFELGGNMILTKHVARNYYRSIYFAFRIRLISIIGTLLVFYTFLFVFNIYQDIRLYIVYTSIGLAFSSLMNLYFAFFRGIRKMNYEAFTLIFQKILFVILALVLIYSDKSGSKAMLGFMISMVIGFLIILFFFKKNELRYVHNEIKQEINFKNYIKDVFTLALVEVFSNIYYKLNQVIIEHFRGFEEVGVYGVAYKIVEVFINFPSILLIVLFPAFAKLAIDNLKNFKIQFDRILIILFICGILSCIISWFLGETIFSLIGKDYDKSYIILRYLTLPMFFLFPNFLITQGLIALDKNIIFATILFTALVLNIIISIILVPLYGAVGSAISIGICEFVIFISGYYFIRKYTTVGLQKA